MDRTPLADEHDYNVMISKLQAPRSFFLEMSRRKLAGNPVAGVAALSNPASEGCKNCRKSEASSLFGPETKYESLPQVPAYADSRITRLGCWT